MMTSATDGSAGGGASVKCRQLLLFPAALRYAAELQPNWSYLPQATCCTLALLLSLSLALFWRVSIATTYAMVMETVQPWFDFLLPWNIPPML